MNQRKDGQMATSQGLGGATDVNIYNTKLRGFKITRKILEFLNWFLFIQNI